MEDVVSPSRHPLAIRLRMLLVLALGASLVLSATLTDHDPPDRWLDEEPIVPEAFAAWFIAFVVTASISAVVARTRPSSPVRMVGPGITLGVGVLLLIPVGLAASIHGAPLDGLLIGPLAFLAASLTLAAIAASRLVAASRLLVLTFASFVGAFTLSNAWEFRVFDDVNVLVIVFAVSAIVAVAATMTLLTPNVRWSREPAGTTPTPPSSAPKKTRPLTVLDVRMSQLGSLLWILVFVLCLGLFLALVLHGASPGGSMWVRHGSPAGGVALAIATAVVSLTFFHGGKPFGTALRSAPARRVIAVVTIGLGLFGASELNVDGRITGSVFALALAALVISSRWPSRIRQGPSRRDVGA